MADSSKRGPDCDNDCERGERGERGKRGQRGRDGKDGRDGSTGPTGFTGFTGPAGFTGFTGPTGPASPSGTAPIIAAALVNGQPPGDGFVSSSGFTSYTRTGPGQYELVLAGTPPPDINCIVNVTLFFNGAVAPVNATVAGGVLGGIVIVAISDAAGTGFVDAVFNVIVTDNR